MWHIYIHLILDHGWVGDITICNLQMRKLTLKETKDMGQDSTQLEGIGARI